MKIFITGGSGFLGSHVAKILAENNHEIKISVHAKNRIDQGRNGKPVVLNNTVVTVLPKKSEDKI